MVFLETSCAFIPPQGQSPSRSVTPSSVETNEVIKYGDAWTGVPGHCVSTSFQPPCPPPQYSDNGHNHGASMIMFPNGTQHINYNTHWFSMLPHLYPIHPGHRFIAAPAVAGGTPFPDGCGPLPPPHSHHSYFEHTSISHPLNPYNGFHPPEYNGNYFPVQAYEPFNDYSFAFYPSQPQPIINDPEAAFQKMTRYPFENSNAFPSPRVYPLSPAILLMSPTANQPTQHQKMIPDSAVQLTPKKLPLDPRNKRTAHTTLHPTPENVLTGSNTRLARRANSHPRSPRSALLEEFRNSRDRKWDLKAIFGHIVEFSSDQHGSRFIQEQLESASDEEKDIVFREIVPHYLDDLVRDVFGNYVVQKYFEFGSPVQINALTSAVEEQVHQLSLNIYGCRVVQKALEVISAKQHVSVIQRLEKHILTCIKDAHGNHVIQKLIQVVDPEHLTFLPTICDNILGLATHPYGCRVLQRCLEHVPGTYTRSLLDAIQCYANDLMKDQYGNYVIQFILEQGQDLDKATVLSAIRGNLIQLAQHKYASNVCEKALMCTDSDSREILINEIMTAKPHTPGEHLILTMVKDQYANYVLQRALTLSEGRQREAFFQQVQPLLIGLRKVTMTYSRPLVSMERLMDGYFKRASDSSANSC